MKTEGRRYVWDFERKAWISTDPTVAARQRDVAKRPIWRMRVRLSDVLERLAQWFRPSTLNIR